MTKMAAMPIYVKTLKKCSPRTNGPPISPRNLVGSIVLAAVLKAGDVHMRENYIIKGVPERSF